MPLDESRASAGRKLGVLLSFGVGEVTMARRPSLLGETHLGRQKERLAATVVGSEEAMLTDETSGALGVADGQPD